MSFNSVSLTQDPATLPNAKLAVSPSCESTEGSFVLVGGIRPAGGLLNALSSIPMQTQPSPAGGSIPSSQIFLTFSVR